MVITNTTATQYDLPGNYQVAPNQAGVTIADADYKNNSQLQQEVNDLVGAGTFTVGTPPSGYSVVAGKLTATPAAGESNAKIVSGTNADGVITIAAAGAGVRNYLDTLAASYNGATEGRVTVEDGSGTVILDEEVNETRDLEFSPALRGSANTAMIVTIKAVASQAGHATVNYHTGA